MTAPESSPRGVDTNARGLMVLGVALVVGFLLLYSWGPGKSSSSSSSSAKTTTTIALDGLTTTSEAGDGGTETTTTLTGSDRAPSEVSVVVLNGGGPAGSAQTTSGTIGAGGYTMGNFTNSPVNVDATTVYYAEGYQADAIAVANLLGLGTDVVKPLTDASLNGAEGDSNVVVILGPDTTAASGSTTTTTTG